MYKKSKLMIKMIKTQILNIHLVICKAHLNLLKIIRRDIMVHFSLTDNCFNRKASTTGFAQVWQVNLSYF